MNKIFEMKRSSIDRHERLLNSEEEKLSRRFYGPDKYKGSTSFASREASADLRDDVAARSSRFAGARKHSMFSKANPLGSLALKPPA